MPHSLNRNIPGQMTDDELQHVISLAQAVPPGGIIVEVGSLYGLSSWHFAKYSPPGVTVFCVDPWHRDQWIIDLVEGPQGAPEFSLEAFQSFTSDCDNIVTIKGYSPQIVRGWNIPIDLYFEDAAHHNPILHDNMEFWSARVKIGGVISGHDYTHHHPDVVSEATAMAQKVGGALIKKGTLWSMNKRRALSDEDPDLMGHHSTEDHRKSWLSKFFTKAK